MRPAYADDAVTVHHGDALDALAELPGGSVHAVVTDPPYGLRFMGSQWDEMPPGREIAAECYRVLKPGGHLLAFGGTRTYHRLVVAIEDAGFEIRDSIHWIYGSGFPKSQNVSKMIDKKGGNPLAFREFARVYALAVESSGYKHSDIDRHLEIKSSSCYWAREDHRGGMPPRHHWDEVRKLLHLDESYERLYDEAEREVIGHKAQGFVPGGNEIYGQFSGDTSITAPATPEAQQWDGWGTALKPAHEPIVVARKPFKQTVAKNVLEHGTGAINVDGCRVPGLVHSASGGVGGYSGSAENAEYARGNGRGEMRDGRWPANVLLDENAAAEMDRQSGYQKDGVAVGGKGAAASIYGTGLEKDDSAGNHGYGGGGGASRFFPVFIYDPKAPADERPRVDGVAHPTTKPLDLMRWLVRLVTPPGGVVLDPFLGSGTTAEACVIEGFHCVGVEREPCGKCRDGCPDYLSQIVTRLSKPIQPTLGDT